jgi:hypothetical protein
VFALYLKTKNFPSYAHEPGRISATIDQQLTANRQLNAIIAVLTLVEAVAGFPSLLRAKGLRSKCSLSLRSILILKIRQARTVSLA